MHARRFDAIALILALAAATQATAQDSQKPETFTGTTVNLGPGVSQKLRINILRWSSDEESTRLASAAKKENGADQLLTTLQAMPSAGYIWTDEELGYTLHYTHRQPLGDGGERIVLATDRALGSWSGHPWTAKTSRSSPDYPFTVVELRLNRSGEGEGKMSITAKVTADEAGKTIELENFEGSPVLLRGVKRESARP